MIRLLSGLLALLVVAIGGATTASAHPHVFVSSSSELVYAPDGTITGVRHAWVFDEMFSAYALQGIPSKTKDVFTRDELKDLAQTNMDSLKEYAYFTYAKGDGKKQRFNEPVDYWLEKKDAALVLHFTLPFKTPFKARQLSLEVFDPSYFVDFSLEKKDPIRLVGAPAACAVAVQAPSDGAAKAQTMSEDSFLNGDNSNYGAMFANKVTVDCP